MSDQYILIGQSPVPCEDLFEWARWMNDGDRIVRQDHLCHGEVLVSTVFLGLDHGFGGRPLLFETMVFDHFELLEQTQERCSTWLEAEAQHVAALTFTRWILRGWRMRLKRFWCRAQAYVEWMDRYRSVEGPYNWLELLQARGTEDYEERSRRLAEFVQRWEVQRWEEEE